MTKHHLYLFALLVLSACAGAQGVQKVCPAPKHWPIPEQVEIVKERAVMLHEDVFIRDKSDGTFKPVRFTAMPGVLDEWERTRQALKAAQ